MNTPIPTVYGIANCDTVKKARAWLTEQGVAYQFHDFKKLGLSEAQLKHWLQSVDWQTLLNRRGTTWRRFDSATQAGVTDADKASALMLEQLSLIKRPVVDWGHKITVGFDAQQWLELIDAGR